MTSIILIPGSGSYFGTVIGETPEHYEIEKKCGLRNIPKEYVGGFGINLILQCNEPIYN
mgnify:FL=1